MDLSNKNVIHVKQENSEYLQFRKLLEYQDILTHAYSLGTDVNYRTAKVNKQNLEKEEYEKAIKDYERLCNCIGDNYINLVNTNQEHTDCLKIVRNKINIDKPDVNLEEYYNTDGLITNKKDIILSTTNADCILMLFFDPVKRVIANIHSGWKGTLKKISVKTVEKMIDKFGCKPKDIICCICPSIHKCHFEVEKDVKEQFEREFKELGLLDEIIEEKIENKKWNIDTILINKVILKEIGLQEQNIIDSGICSMCNSNLIHSYRVEKQGYGLNTALIELKNSL